MGQGCLCEVKVAMWGKGGYVPVMQYIRCCGSPGAGFRD